MSLVIPVRPLPAYSFEVNLDNVIYRMAFQWNSVHEFWTMDVQTREAENLITGIKLVINYELITRYVDPNLPAGAIIALDTTGKLERIGRNDLGNDVKLIYIPRGEFDDLVQ